jgi:hypothetical protein
MEWPNRVLFVEQSLGKSNQGWLVRCMLFMAIDHSESDLRSRIVDPLNGELFSVLCGPRSVDAFVTLALAGIACTEYRDWAERSGVHVTPRTGVYRRGRCFVVLEDSMAVTAIAGAAQRCVRGVSVF